MAIIIASIMVSACSHQQVAQVSPEPIDVTPPVVQTPDPVAVIPAPEPYPDKIIQPAPLPAPVVKPQPAPVVKPKPAPVMPTSRPVYVPPVKAKGNYRGAIPINQDLRQHYQR
ncbi:MAG: hypothetical protein CSA79_03400 [Thiothrix nivea]|nr:MAG: hypothetical protein CSA79_03400 [Thiothrix nivea]